MKRLIPDLDLAEAHWYAGWILLAVGGAAMVAFSLGIGLGLFVLGIGAVVSGIVIEPAPASPALSPRTSSQDAFAPLLAASPESPEETA